MLNFDFLETDVAIVYLPHLCMIFQEKCFSYYIPFPRVRGTEIFSRLIVFFFSQEIFLTELNT